NDRNEVAQNAVQNMGIQIVKNMNGFSVVSKISNQYGNRNVVTSQAEGNGNGINGGCGGVIGGGVADCGWGGDEDDEDGRLWWWLKRWRRRVVASGVVDLVDQGGRSVFGVRRKSFLAAAVVAGGWPAVGRE
nr:hypothetical protein [Tanacetum cinerariifolium]